MFFKKKINPSLELLLAYAEEQKIIVNVLATDCSTAHYPTRVIFLGTKPAKELKNCWCVVSTFAHEIGHIIGETSDEEKAWDIGRLLLIQLIGELPINFEAMRKACLATYGL